MEAQLTPLQLDATSGTGRILIVPDPPRMVYFLIRVKGSPMGGQIQIEYSAMNTGPEMGAGPFADPSPIVWRPAGGAISVPADIFSVGRYGAGEVSGMFRANILTPISGGTVTVWLLVGVLIGNTNKALEPVVR
jgi:hypothetical protein